MSMSPDKWSLWNKRLIGFVVGPLLGLVILVMPFPSLTPQAHTLAAILIWVVVFWITEAIPLPITSLLGAGLCVFAGLDSMKAVFASFAHPIIFLFIGSFFIAEAFVVHGVDRKFALWLISFRWVGAKPARLFFMMGCASAILSMWISNTAAVAIMLPIALGILTNLRKSASHPETYETGVMLLLAYGAAVGGVATMIGTPPNLIGVGLLAEQGDQALSFFTWMAVGLPLGLVMFFAVYKVLFWLHPIGGDFIQLPPKLEKESVRLEKWTRGQINTCIALGLAVFLWIAPGFLSIFVGREHGLVSWLNSHLPKELVAVLAASLLFILPLDARKGLFSLSWKQAMNINWGIILLFGGGVWVLTAIAIVAALVLTEMASNTASASMLVPIVIAIAHSSGLSPVPPTLGVCMAASLAFVLPVSTPPNAMVYGTGLIPLSKMIQAGLLLDVIGGILVWVMLRLLCPLLGLA